MTGAKPISVAHSAKDETSRTSCILWACSQIGNFEFGAMRSVIGLPRFWLGTSIHRGFLKLRARLRSTLKRRDHRTLTSIRAGGSSTPATPLLIARSAMRRSSTRLTSTQRGDATLLAGIHSIGRYFRHPAGLRITRAGVERQKSRHRVWRVAAFLPMDTQMSACCYARCNKGCVRRSIS